MTIFQGRDQRELLRHICPSCILRHAFQAESRKVTRQDNYISHWGWEKVDPGTAEHSWSWFFLWLALPGLRVTCLRKKHTSVTAFLNVKYLHGVSVFVDIWWLKHGSLQRQTITWNEIFMAFILLTQIGFCEHDCAHSVCINL
jgi:hypothetical protein